jgi:hypothetical protein
VVCGVKTKYVFSLNLNTVLYKDAYGVLKINKNK